MNIESQDTYLHGLSYGKTYDLWVVHSTKLDIQQQFSVKTFGFNKAKLLGAQLICTKLLENNALNLEKSELVKMFKDLNIK